MLKALIFDVDGVLIKTHTANVQTYRKMLNKAGCDAPDNAIIEKLVHLPLWEGIKRLLKTDDINEINRVRDIFVASDTQQKSRIIFQDNIVKVLEELSKKYQLAVATGRFRAGMQEVFAQNDISSYFDCVVTYEDTIEHKPHPEPLLLALKKIHVLPSEAAYVGDMDYDVVAAKGAQMASIQVSPKQIQGADIWIRDFSQIITAADKLGVDKNGECV